ncbi:MAG: type II toxin-antitoxin system prevent-host-death family antitoxin [Rhodobacterales bacterium]|nr:type II toxin-antitoxin system prevent-host-death family antitoxin [Rhodobacterales bacterium]
MQMNIAEAKAKLSEVIAAAERGEDVVIERGGRPIARLGSAQAKGSAFRLAIAEGEVLLFQVWGSHSQRSPAAQYRPAAGF